MKSYLIIFCVIFSVITQSCQKRNDTFYTEFNIKEFSFQGHDAKIVFPNKKTDHNFWIWRARFWGTAPQLDKALLNRGFHLVYVDVSDLFGNDEAVKLWNDFYAYCIKEYNLNKKVVLEGMSRGGLIVYNWASQNTDKVFSIYADAPVCDIKSWPGGIFSGVGSPKDWNTCLNAHDLDSLSVMHFKKNPLNTCLNIAKAQIPVIHVYGDSDKVVPHTENTLLLAENFKNAGGTIKLIKKEGVGHHPHSLKDPKPILNFILDHLE